MQEMWPEKGGRQVCGKDEALSRSEGPRPSEYMGKMYELGDPG